MNAPALGLLHPDPVDPDGVLGPISLADVHDLYGVGFGEHDPRPWWTGWLVDRIAHEEWTPLALAEKDTLSRLLSLANAPEPRVDEFEEADFDPRAWTEFNA